MSLLQEAIERHASSKKLHPPSSPPSEGVRNLTLVDESDGYVNISTNGRSSSRQDDALSESDDESFILVRTVPNTPRTQSRAASRSTSPSRLSSSRRRREKEREKESLGADGVRRALDPLKWFPNHITMVIFKEVTKAGLGDEEGEDAAVKNLLRCGRVCKRWRKSQTISEPLAQSFCSNLHGLMTLALCPRDRLPVVPTCKIFDLRLRRSTLIPLVLATDLDPERVQNGLGVPVSFHTPAR